MAPPQDGIYRRRIRICTAAGQVRADLEDDPHRFGVTVWHDGSHVTQVKGDPIRTPWDLCPAAAEQLQGLVGMRLSVDLQAARALVDPRSQCTHMFDLAALAIGYAACPAAPATRQYDIEAPMVAGQTRRIINMRRDGEPLLSWELDRTMIVAPPPYAGRDVRTILDWATETLAADELEAVAVLRRAVLISNSRKVDLDLHRTPVAFTGRMGACFVFQPERVGQARRMFGATRDFSADEHALLADLTPPAPAP